MYPFGLIATGP